MEKKITLLVACFILGACSNDNARKTIVPSASDNDIIKSINESKETDEYKSSEAVKIDEKSESSVVSSALDYEDNNPINENKSTDETKSSEEVKSNDKADVFTLISSQVNEGGTIPLEMVCSAYGGNNQSPQLSWSNQPDSTFSFAVIMDDETPPCGVEDLACVHWGLFNLPSEVSGINEGFTISTQPGTVEGSNYTNSQGYAGPCPPSKHTYKTTVYALKESMPNLGDITGIRVLTRHEFENTYKSHILGTATITATFDPGMP